MIAALLLALAVLKSNECTPPPIPVVGEVVAVTGSSRLAVQTEGNNLLPVVLSGVEVLPGKEECALLFLNRFVVGKRVVVWVEGIQQGTGFPFATVKHAGVNLNRSMVQAKIAKEN